MHIRDQIKINRNILFEKQNGRCCYCDEKAILPENLTGHKQKHHPQYTATLEHLVPLSEKSQLIDERDYLKFQRMACKYCNCLMADIPAKYRKNFFGKIKRPLYLNPE